MGVSQVWTDTFEGVKPPWNRYLPIEEDRE